jgi:hypothetical protein
VDREHCRYCGKKGHWARECRKKQRDAAAKASKARGAANLVQAEEDEGPGLMMASVEEVSEPAQESSIVSHIGGQIFLNEEKAIVTPTLDGGGQGWFLDTGAMNHMTGAADAFAVLDRSVAGKVRFADGSVVDIHGRGTVVFTVDKGGHRAFTDVFFIPALRSSIVSLGQLDESCYDVRIRRGLLTVRDHHNRLVMEVKRSPNRLYKFKFTH